MTGNWNRADYVDRCARRIAELHCFRSDFVWRMIWVEIIPKPKKVFNTRGVLEALWFICGELYQGVYPCRQDVHEWLELQPSIGGTPTKKASSPSVSKALNQVVTIPIDYRQKMRYKEKGRTATMSGWFTLKEGEDLALEEGYSDGEAVQFKQYDYIVPENETASRNIIAIMKTVVNVGEYTRSPAFVDEMAKMLQDYGDSETFESHCEVVLNHFRDEKRSYRWRVANLIRHYLQKNGFETKPKDDRMKIRAKCLDKGRPPVNILEKDWILFPGEDRTPADEGKRDPAPVLLCKGPGSRPHTARSGAT